jgi:hypothetical protein
MFKGSENLRKYGKHLLRAYAFSIPISIALSQVFFFLFIVVELPNIKKAFQLRALNPLRSQLICWFAVTFIACFASVDFLRSFGESGKALSYLLFLVLVLNFLEGREDPKERMLEILRVLLFLIIGQSISSLGTVLSLSLGVYTTFGLPGDVTKSGQLALVLPAITGVMLGTKSQKIISTQRFISVLLFVAISLLVTVRVMNFKYAVFYQPPLILMVGILLWKLHFFSYLRRFWSTTYTQASFLALAFLPLLICAFIFQLKRGPWIGVLFAITFLGIQLGNRKVVLGVIISGLSMLTFPIVRNRLFNLITDFTIAGGRERMWTIGLEIASRFPLGVGPKNSIFMRTLDPYLPPTHRHLHNNLLNVIVEMGYLGGVIFIWWMLTLIYLGFRWARVAATASDPSIRRAALLAVSLSAAILSSQFAGMFEYNFGDAEIKSISFLFMALLLSVNYLIEQSLKRE